MVRENNQKVFNTFQVDDQPKFGAGSAFGKDAKVINSRETYIFKNLLPPAPLPLQKVCVQNTSFFLYL